MYFVKLSLLKLRKVVQACDPQKKPETAISILPVPPRVYQSSSSAAGFLPARFARADMRSFALGFTRPPAAGGAPFAAPDLEAPPGGGGGGGGGAGARPGADPPPGRGGAGGAAARFGREGIGGARGAPFVAGTDGFEGMEGFEGIAGFGFAPIGGLGGGALPGTQQTA